MSACRLVMTDIDGTVMPYGRDRVSRRTVDAIHAAQAAGIECGPVSGRFYGWIPRFFRDDEACCSTAIAANGAQVWHRGELVCERTMDPSALREACRVLREVPRSGMVLFAGDRPLLVQGSREDLAVAFPRYARECEDAPGVPDAPVVKANAFVRGTLDETRAMVDLLARSVPELDFDLPQPMFCNMMAHGWNKGSALAWLCDYLSVPLDEAVVFGDAGNDVALFERATHSVAVAGATPEARDAARWHVGRCEDDAVAQAIEALARGEWPFSA